VKGYPITALPEDSRMMTVPTLLIYLALNPAMKWEFSHVEHINGTGAREYCEDRRRWKDAQFEGKPGDLRIVCTEDQSVEL
jgi:hypothetical protein